MNKILGISNGNYIDMLLSKKMFSFKINKLSTTDNILNGKPCGILYTGYLNKDISFGDIVYFEPRNVLECYMDWFPSLICKNYIFKYFVKTVEPTSLKFCTIIELITLHLEYTIAQVKYAKFSYAHAQTFVLLNREMATVSTGFRKLKFWLWLLQTVFYLSQTGF